MSVRELFIPCIGHVFDSWYYYMEFNNYLDRTIFIPQLSEGDKIFHYTSAAGIQGISNGEFWVTEKSFLNDYTEFQVATDAFCEMLKLHMKDKRKCRVIQKKVRDEVNYLQETSLTTESRLSYDGDYVISFCLEDDSPLMWSSYSDHAGYCIQFDYNKFKKAIYKNFKWSCFDGRVIYNRTEQIECLERTIKKEFFDEPEYGYLNTWDDLDNMSDDNIKNWKLHMSVIILLYNMFFKLPCFEGEHEYRFVLSAPHDGGIHKLKEYCNQGFRIKDEVLIPYITVGVDIDSIEKVIIGSKNKSDMAVRGLQCLFRNLKHDIKVEKSSIPLRY